MQQDRRLIVITGPTASGKSALAIEMARNLDTEIISADSRQIFRGIPIVTAVPSLEERQGIPHHLMETLPLEAYYSAAMFEQDALRIAGEIWDSGRRDVVVCGGSMMYIDALCNGIDEMPTVEESVRQSLMEEWQREGDAWLRMRLMALDPEYYSRVDLMNMKRVFHAVEVSVSAGRPYSTLLGKEKKKREFEIIKLGVEREREELFERINRRVEQMLEAGMLDEAKRVYPKRELNSLNTVGFKEIFRYFDGEWDLPTAIARIQKNTRVYAKKQMTWLKRDPSIRWIAPDTPAVLSML